MILTDYFQSAPSLQWDYAKQAGVNHATLRLPDDPAFNFTNKNQWRSIFKRFEEFGVKPVVLEPLPNQLHAHIKAGIISATNVSRACKKCWLSWMNWISVQSASTLWRTLDGFAPITLFRSAAGHLSADSITASSPTKTRYVSPKNSCGTI